MITCQRCGVEVPSLWAEHTCVNRFPIRIPRYDLIGRFVLACFAVDVRVDPFEVLDAIARIDETDLANEVEERLSAEDVSTIRRMSESMRDDAYEAINDFLAANYAEEDMFR